MHVMVAAYYVTTGGGWSTRRPRPPKRAYMGKIGTESRYDILGFRTTT